MKKILLCLFLAAVLCLSLLPMGIGAISADAAVTELAADEENATPADGASDTTDGSDLWLWIIIPAVVLITLMVELCVWAWRKHRRK